MKFKWDKSYFGIGLTAFLVIACGILFFMFVNRIDVVFSVISWILGILMPIIYGLVIAYLLNPLLKFFEHTCFKRIHSDEKYSKLRRALSITCMVIVVLVMFTGFFWLLIPQLVTSISSLVERIPNYFDTAKSYVDNFFANNTFLHEWFGIDVNQLFTYLENALQQYLPMLSNVLEGATTAATGVVTTLMYLLVGFVIAIYVLYSKERFGAQSKKVMFALFPRNFTLKSIDILSQTDQMFSGYIFGKVVEALCVAVLCFLGCTLLQIPYALIVSVIMFVFNLIPYFGPLIGAIPCTLLILLVDPLKALWFVILIAVLQQFDGNVIGPVILGNQTGLPSFWIIFSIFLFGGLFGFMGMLIGVPTFAVLYSLLRALVEKKLKAKGMPVSTRDYMRMDHIKPSDTLVIMEQDVKREVNLKFLNKKKNNPAAKKSNESAGGQKNESSGWKSDGNGENS